MSVFSWLKRNTKPSIEWRESWEVINGDLEICHVYRCDYRGLNIKTVCDNRWFIWKTYYYKEGSCIALKHSIAHRESPKWPSIEMANKIIAGLEYMERMKTTGKENHHD